MTRLVTSFMTLTHKGHSSYEGMCTLTHDHDDECMKRHLGRCKMQVGSAE